MIKSFKDYIKESLIDYFNGVDIEDALKNNPTSVLKHAFNIDDMNLFKNALEHGADINFNDGFLLKYNSSKGNLDKVIFLIENGAEPNFSQYISDAPIVGAARNGHAEIVKYLLDNGACTDAYERDLKQALTWAKSNIKLAETSEKKQEYKKVIKYLEDFQWGSDIF